MRTLLTFDDDTNLIPLGPETLACMTERQRKAFARYAAAHRVARALPLRPEEQELSDALAGMDAADDDAMHAALRKLRESLS
jgi:hypothetical protein